MRIVFVTPFSPFREHDHAASDVLAELVKRLAAQHELHVFSPEIRSAAERELADAYGVHVWEASPRSTPRLCAAAGLRPYWLREAWARDLGAQARNVIARARPDVVHCEYLQTGDVVRAARCPTVVRLHDVTVDVMARAYGAARGARKLYRLAEWARTVDFERRVVRAATIPVTLSLTDARHFLGLNDETCYIPTGVDVPHDAWAGGARDSRSIVFTGAMWREANERAALRLAHEIMPRVWSVHPDVTLRIVGAEPGPSVTALAADARVAVTGRVPSIDAEIRRAAVVACPTVYGGGVLVKLLRALAVGAPVVTDTSSAASVGIDDDAASVANSSEAFAARVCELLDAPDAAAGLGARGRAFVEQSFAWSRVASAYSAAYLRAVEVGR